MQFFPSRQTQLHQQLRQQGKISRPLMIHRIPTRKHPPNVQYFSLSSSRKYITAPTIKNAKAMRKQIARPRFIEHKFLHLLFLIFLFCLRTSFYLVSYQELVPHLWQIKGPSQNCWYPQVLHTTNFSIPVVISDVITIMTTQK